MRATALIPGASPGASAAGAVCVMAASAGASGKGHRCDGFESRGKSRCKEWEWEAWKWEWEVVM
jgi:hypothetical protein